MPCAFQCITISCCCWLRPVAFPRFAWLHRRVFRDLKSLKAGAIEAWNPALHLHGRFSQGEHHIFHLDMPAWSWLRNALHSDLLEDAFHSVYPLLQPCELSVGVTLLFAHGPYFLPCEHRGRGEELVLEPQPGPFLPREPVIGDREHL